VGWARSNQITQIFISRDHSTSRKLLPGLDFVDQVVQRARNLQVTIVREHLREGKAPAPYAADIAGGLMSSRFARISPDMSVDEAIGELRRQAGSVEMLYYAYVLDANQRLAGVVSFRDLFSADRTKKVGDVMKTDCVTVYEDTECELAADLFTKYRLLAIPVIDHERQMRGIITTSDLVGLIQEEASEDIQKIGGMEALGAPYLQVGFRRMVRKRAGWLAILFVGEMLTATAMGFFEGEIAKAAVLALFLPLIISSGGNSGSQATTLVIRAMGMGELGLRDWWRVIRREFFTGMTLGLLLGVIGVVRILVWQGIGGMYGIHYHLVALTIGCSLIGVVTFGTLAGSMLPFILRRCGLDPASASAPFVATLVDVTGLIIYFTVALFILRGSLL
jgi:magnesium transporter